MNWITEGYVKEIYYEVIKNKNQLKFSIEPIPPYRLETLYNDNQKNVIVLFFEGDSNAQTNSIGTKAGMHDAVAVNSGEVMFFANNLKMNFSDLQSLKQSKSRIRIRIKEKPGFKKKESEHFIKSVIEAITVK